MKLPLELRNQICISVLATENERPDTTKAFEELISGRVQYETPRLEVGCQVVLYLPEGAINNIPSLLLVNRQLHAETMANLDFIAAKRPSYCLDVVVLDEILLLPTWLSVPFITTNLDTVNITFRISGSYDARKEFDIEMNRRGPYAKWAHFKGFRSCKGESAMRFQVCAVLERFVRVGPAGEVENEFEHKHFTAKCMKIDFQTPPDIPLERLGSPISGRGFFGGDKNSRGRVLDPDVLARFVADDLRDMLTVQDGPALNYSEILFEHLDELVLFRDGKEFERWDIAEQLRDLEDREWMKEYTWQIRRGRGLKCLD